MVSWHTTPGICPPHHHPPATANSCRTLSRMKYRLSSRWPFSARPLACIKSCSAILSRFFWETLFVHKRVHEFTSHAGTEAYILWWRCSEIEDKRSGETLQNLLSIAVPKQVENSCKLTSMKPYWLTAHQSLSLPSFLRSTRVAGKASSSWSSKPKLYSGNYPCFPVQTCSSFQTWVYELPWYGYGNATIQKYHTAHCPQSAEDTLSNCDRFLRLRHIKPGKYFETGRDLPC